MSPGMMNCPVASMTWSSGRTRLTPCVASTSTMSVPSMTMAVFGRGGAPVPSISVPCVMTRRTVEVLPVVSSSRSRAGEARRALLQERAHAFAVVLARGRARGEGIDLRLALGHRAGDERGQRDLGAGDGDRRAL